MSTPSTLPQLPGPFTPDEWLAVAGSLGFAGAVAAEMSTPEQTHPGVGYALLAIQAIKRVAGDEGFTRIMAFVDTAAAEEEARREGSIEEGAVS